MAGDESQGVKPSALPTKIPEEFDLVVVNMDRVLYEGKAKSLIAPAWYGNFAVLPGHAPSFIKLEKGSLYIDTGAKPVEIKIDGGIAKINQIQTVVLVGFEKVEKST